MNKIIVIGGGPAGMFAALAAAETGSQVIDYVEFRRRNDR